jgi:hypothetical protein
MCLGLTFVMVTGNTTGPSVILCRKHHTQNIENLQNHRKHHITDLCASALAIPLCTVATVALNSGTGNNALQSDSSPAAATGGLYSKHNPVAHVAGPWQMKTNLTPTLQVDAE